MEHYVPLILGLAKGCRVGLWPSTWAFDPVTIKFMDDLGRPKGSYPDIFMFISLLEMCQESGIKKGCTFRDLTVPDQRHGRTGSSSTIWLIFFHSKWETVKFFWWYLNQRACQEWGLKKGGTWRILWVPDWKHGTHVHSLRYEWLFYLKEYTLKIWRWFFCLKCVKRGRSRNGELGGCWWFLKEYMEDSAIFDAYRWCS